MVLLERLPGILDIQFYSACLLHLLSLGLEPVVEAQCPGMSSTLSQWSSWRWGRTALWEGCGQLPNWLFKTSILQQFPPTAVSLPVPCAGGLFQWSFFLILSQHSGSATKISAPHLCVWESLLFFNFFFFLNEFESYQLKLKGSWYLLGTYFIWQAPTYNVHVFYITFIFL